MRAFGCVLLQQYNAFVSAMKEVENTERKNLENKPHTYGVDFAVGRTPVTNLSPMTSANYCPL